MKTLLTLTSLGLLLSLWPASADEKKAPAKAAEKSAAKKDDHDHDHDHGGKLGGPTGGRMIYDIEPHAEFFVTKDKKVEIRFFDHDNKPVAPGEQVVTVTLGDRSKPTKLTFTKDGDKLVSDNAVPEGNNHPTVVQIKATAKAKAVNAKFNLNLTECPSCDNKEYACNCDHGHDHEGHDHDHEKK